jgi:hypothetical protein
MVELRKALCFNVRHPLFSKSCVMNETHLNRGLLSNMCEEPLVCASLALVDRTTACGLATSMISTNKLKHSIVFRIPKRAQRLAPLIHLLT